MSARFDDLTEAMAGPHSRRGVLKMFGMAVVGGAVATVLKPFRGSAFPPPMCTGPTNLGSSPCAAGATPCGPCCCKAGIACLDKTSGVCGCPSGTTPCGSACCQKGTACANPSTSTCATTAVACTQGQAACGKVCCPSGQVCLSGTCTTCSSFSAVLTAPVQSGTTNTSLSVSPLSAPVSTGDSVIINPAGSPTQTVTASAPASAGATTIQVQLFVANATYLDGTPVQGC